jgi:hypothetical protein
MFADPKSIATRSPEVDDHHPCFEFPDLSALSGIEHACRPASGDKTVRDLAAACGRTE